MAETWIRKNRVLAILEDEGALKDAEPKPALITNGTRERITVVPQYNKQEPCSVL
jgi:hypothetical protein